MFAWARWFSYLWLFWFLLVGCGSPAQVVVAPTPVSTEVAMPSPTPPVLPAIEVPTPAQDYGIVYGQILQGDGTAAVGLAVVLCQTFSQYDACGGRRYATDSEEDGTYIITDVEPGAYALAVYLDEKEGQPLQFVVDETLRVKMFEVSANETEKIEPLFVFGNDIKVTAPLTIVRLPSETAVHKLTGETTLRWRPYPGAAVYEVYLAPVRGAVIFVNERVAAERITAVLPRVNCDYYWQVSAFDAANIKIAETAGNPQFSVTSENASCELALLPVAVGEVVSGTRKITLDWEKHETADHYQVWLIDLQNPDRPAVLDFEEVTNSDYELANGLLPSHYIWAVFAYDEQGRMIAESEVARFEVAPLEGD